MPRTIIVIAHDIRSIHNVGSLLRTAEGLGITKVYLTGYTPYPASPADTRLPHEQLKINKAIQKTALGSEELVDWEHVSAVEPLIKQLKQEGYAICALEQADKSVSLPSYQAPTKVALLLGREVEGITPDVLKLCDTVLEIPMLGRKESFNVVQAAAMALYQLTFLDR